MATLELDKALSDSFAAKVEDLLFQWAPRPDAADYKCAFCGKYAVHNHALVVDHDPNCLGVAFLRAIGKLP